MKLFAFAGYTGSGKDTAAQILQQHVKNVHILKFAHPLYDTLAILDGSYDKDHSHRYRFDSLEVKDNYRVDLSAMHSVPQVKRVMVEAIVRLFCGEDPYGVSSLERSTLIVDGQLYTASKLYTLFSMQLDALLPYDTYTPRQIMQTIGTELVREYISPATWTTLLENKLMYLPDNAVAIVSDLRFPNEVLFLKNLRASLVYLSNPVALQKAKGAAKMAHSSESHQEYLKANADYWIDNPMTDPPTEESLQLFESRVMTLYKMVADNEDWRN